MANNKISPLAALNRSEGDKRGVSSLKGYGQPSTIGEFLGGFTGAPRRFSVMDPEAAGMQTARDIGEQASVAGQMFGAMTPFAASAAAAKAGHPSATVGWVAERWEETRAGLQHQSPDFPNLWSAD